MTNTAVLAFGTVFCLVACSSQPDAELTVGSQTSALSQTDNGIAPSRPNLADYVHVPGIGGKLVHKSCVSAVPDGATIERNGDVSLKGKVIAHYDKCNVAPIDPQNPPSGSEGDGWVEDAQESAYITTDHFGYMQSNFYVPADPGATGGLVYLFPSLTTYDQVAIIQSVLQYGYNGNFGGNYWTFTGWVVDGINCANHCYYDASYMTPSVGDELQGWYQDNDYRPSRNGPCSVTGSQVISKDLTTSVGNGLTTPWYAWGNTQSGVLEAYI